MHHCTTNSLTINARIQKKTKLQNKNIAITTKCQRKNKPKCFCHTFYTVNHKKRDILFLTITSANLNRFL